MVWGTSAAMQAARECVERAAPSDCAILLTGETGTGKGEVARAIHALSPRAGARRVHVDCAALSPTVIESELFGHERGAFTDAGARRPGRFELAAGGTLFLDEIAELAPGLQAKLLRVLHDRSFERVGGTATLAMRSRIVAATNRPLAADVAVGRFRADLYYRLAVVEIELPPLREHLEDLPALAGRIGAELSVRLGRRVRLPTPAALEVLGRHRWPGNVRELVNLLERVAVCWPEQGFDRGVALRALGSGGMVPRVSSALGSGPPALGPELLARTLAECGGNISRAARRLGLPRSTLRYRLRRGVAGLGEACGAAQGQLSLPFDGPAAARVNSPLGSADDPP